MKYVFYHILLGALFFVGCNGLEQKKEYYVNGELKSEWYENSDGLKNGESKFYYQDRTLKNTSNWLNDTLEGDVLLYYENGILKEKGTYQKGKRSGIFIFYNKEGARLQESFFVEGFRNGEMISFLHDSIGGGIEKEYFVNFHGKETSLGWYAIDKNGKVFNESRRVSFFIQNDTVFVGKEFEIILELRKPRFNKTEFILGNYDDKFFLKDSMSLDTLVATDQIAKLKLIPKEKGLHNIRGFARNYNPLPNGYYEQVNSVYFEKRYFVK